MSDAHGNMHLRSGIFYSPASRPSANNAAFRLCARSDCVDCSDTIATIDTIAAETLQHPSRDRIAMIAGHE